VTRSHTILLVEDNPDDVELTLRAFEKSDLARHIVVVRDGADALEISSSPAVMRGVPSRRRPRSSSST
jgi:CheY-like chemotaxis protein